MAQISSLIPTCLGWMPTGDLGPYTIYTNKNGKIVWFPRAPPLMPPTLAQIIQRQKLSDAAAAWNRLSAEQRARWKKMVDRTSACVGAFPLFFFHLSHPGEQVTQTMARQAKVPYPG